MAGLSHGIRGNEKQHQTESTHCPDAAKGEEANKLRREGQPHQDPCNGRNRQIDVKRDGDIRLQDSQYHVCKSRSPQRYGDIVEPKRCECFKRGRDKGNLHNPHPPRKAPQRTNLIPCRESDDDEHGNHEHDCGTDERLASANLLPPKMLADQTREPMVIAPMPHVHIS